MAGEHGLELGRVHVVAAGDDDVARPVDDVTKPLLVASHDVAGVVPAVRKHLVGGCRLFQYPDIRLGPARAARRRRRRRPDRLVSTTGFRSPASRGRPTPDGRRRLRDPPRQHQHRVRRLARCRTPGRSGGQRVEGIGQPRRGDGCAAVGDRTKRLSSRPDDARCLDHDSIIVGTMKLWVIRCRSTGCQEPAGSHLGIGTLRLPRTIVGQHLRPAAVGHRGDVGHRVLRAEGRSRWRAC